tara:strand:+ start:7759 stop:8118 length:360 start_codon:yes stop_codon:yes gene_type:complete
MAFSYCPHCGYKNMYSINPPKFCGGCGESLTVLSAAKQRSGKSATLRSSLRKTKDIVIDDPDGLDIYEVPRISKLSYSIEQEQNKYNLEDLVPLEELEEFTEDEPPVKKTKKRGRPKKS